MESVDGDKTAWFHLVQQQVLLSEFVAGKITSTTTMFNIEVGENAVLHVSTGAMWNNIKLPVFVGYFSHFFEK